jgi:hypothetical protein
MYGTEINNYVGGLKPVYDNNNEIVDYEVTKKASF